ncbi:cytochrome D1 domain-containing protein [Candidatus Venteria ishoeyi]|uniref:Cytochrome D1 heme domain protein n=1 Tax=Candidatus Venteria ishoeyi TaxID=1899563 RepID=A0A1H6FG20_9GAMM|nr:cytochrome D1 domain-containing protein [Candidatus Venteria ishoeyi]MDM8546119.1 cytochrome D1 domain-containing protein [Candidatus Venteria ishoeyi]SEH07985.1 Cytochrome D1 heme domain protein [Candidatus Venteria ishoeyi]
MIKMFLRVSLFSLLVTLVQAEGLRGTGDMGIVIERATGSVLIIEHSSNTQLARVEGLGDLSHASAVFSRDARYAYIFGRDGGLTKIDLLTAKIVKRVMQSGNSIGGAISQDGQIVAVSNYKPGGVKLFAASDLAQLADIPATYEQNKQSKVIGLVDAPGQQFVFSLFDAGEIWLLDAKQSLSKPHIQKFSNIGKQPYDGLITPDGRYYLAGLFGEDGLALLDLWQAEKGAQHILPNYGKGQQKLPVYKMPHLEGWAEAGNYLFVPAVGQHAVLVIDKSNWQLVKTIPAHGQPIFVMSQPDQRRVWVNFALPNNDSLQIIDTFTLETLKTFKSGKGTLHMEFTPRGENVWVSVRDEDKLNIYDTATFELRASLPAHKPSGIFFTSRAHWTGL